MKKLIFFLMLVLSNSAYSMNDYIQTKESGSKHIMFCVRDGEVDYVRQGLVQGANVNSDYNMGWSLIDMAICRDRMDIAKMLFKAGAAKPTRYPDESLNPAESQSTQLQRFNIVLGWYSQRDLLEAVAHRSNDQESDEEFEYEQNDSQSWRSQISAHLPKIGIAVGTMTILALASRCLYKKYTAKNKVQDKEQVQEKIA